jgi:ankyrin repeat protein
VRKDLFDKIWNSVLKLELLRQHDNNGNLPLHVAAGNNQVDMCEKFLKACESSNELLLKKNFQGQTAAHVATTAMHRCIGPERHYIEKDEREKHHDHEAKVDTAENNDEHDFGLPVLEKMWDITSKYGQSSGLFELDDDRKTCLHLAAENGKSEQYVEIVSPRKS